MNGSGEGGVSSRALEKRTQNHVGTGAPGCPAEQGFAGFVAWAGTRKEDSEEDLVEPCSTGQPRAAVPTWFVPVAAPEV